MNPKVLILAVVAIAAGAVLALRPSATPASMPAATTAARLPKLLDLGADVREIAILLVRERPLGIGRMGRQKFRQRQQVVGVA